MAEILPKDAVARIRAPQFIITDAYLDDPIKFVPDERFTPETILRQLDSASVVSRDPAEYAVVNINAVSGSNYPVTMASPIYRRADVARVIDKTFRHFV